EELDPEWAAWASGLVGPSNPVTAPRQARTAGGVLEAAGEQDLVSPAEPAAHGEDRQASSAASRPAPEPRTPRVPQVEEPADEFVEYRSSGIPRLIMGTIFVIAAVGAVLAIFFSVEDGSAPSILLVVSLVLISLACWWGLLSWSPRIISVSDGLLEVARGAQSERFDLRDPSLDISIGDSPESRDWN